MSYYYPEYKNGALVGLYTVRQSFTAVEPIAENSPEAEAFFGKLSAEVSQGRATALLEANGYSAHRIVGLLSIKEDGQQLGEKALAAEAWLKAVQVAASTGQELPACPYTYDDVIQELLNG